MVDHIPEDRLHAVCVVGSNEPVTLQFLVEDYLAHHRPHVKQAAAGTGLAG